MKKRFMSIAAMAVSLMMLTSCGVNNNVSTEQAKTKSDEVLVKDTAENFMDAFVDLDMTKAKKYTTSGTARDALSTLNPKTLVDGIVEGMGDFADYVDDDIIDNVSNHVIDVFAGSLNYKLGEIEVDGDEATVELTLKTPDFDALSAVNFDDMDESTLMSKMEEIFGFSFDDPAALIADLEAKGIDVNSITDADEGTSTIINAYSEEFTTFVNWMVDTMFGTVSTIETDGTLTLTKTSNGKWRVKDMDVDI